MTRDAGVDRTFLCMLSESCHQIINTFQVTTLLQLSSLSSPEVRIDPIHSHSTWHRLFYRVTPSCPIHAIGILGAHLFSPRSPVNRIPVRLSLAGFY